MGVGLKEIAKAAGVSVHTVSDILNRGRENLYRPETRERVLEISRKMHYRPNRAAQSMRSKKNRIIGFVTIDLASDGTVENPIIYPFLVGTSRHLTRLGYHVGLLELDEIETLDGTELPPVLQEHFFDGLVVHYGLPQRFVSKLDIPVLWWDSGVFEKHGCIYRDEGEIGRMLTRSLIQLGHKRIAFMLGNPQTEYSEAGRPLHFSFMKRYESYLAEMQSHGLPAATIAGQDIPAIAAQLKQVNATAVIIYTTGELSYLQVAAQINGQRIPQDLSVATCDFDAHARSIGVKCGGMSYDRFDAGDRAAKMIFQMIEKPAEKVPTVTLLGEFQPRETVMKPPG